MTTSLNPKKIAHDIAKGSVYLNPVTMKRYTTDDLKVLLSQLMIVQREIRATHIPQEDQMMSNARNRQLQHIHQAITMMNGYTKKHHVRLS
jgi:hypothetical protein